MRHAHAAVEAAWSAVYGQMRRRRSCGAERSVGRLVIVARGQGDAGGLEFGIRACGVEPEPCSHALPQSVYQAPPHLPYSKSAFSSGAEHPRVASAAPAAS